MHQLTTRRSFLATAAIGAAACAWPLRSSRGAADRLPLEVGEGIVETTPPLGLEMAGFHRPVGEERRITGIRGPTFARALVLRQGVTQVAIVSLDIICVSADMATRIQQQVERTLGIPATNVRVCATHTHSMPTFIPLRQWGGVPLEYMATTEKNILRAIQLAQADLAAGDVYLGKSRAPGANNNRTVKEWKSDEEFTKESGDDQRWLDTMVHVLHFDRGGNKKNLLWYHFSAHPVCFQDDQAGPDWPGMVESLVRDKHKLTPSFLQGHCGDVNAGDAEHWIGSVENTAGPVATAITQAIDGARRVEPTTLRITTEQAHLPLDMALFKSWLEQYRTDPAQCASGPWVDERFAQAWYQDSVQRDLTQTQLPVSLCAIQLGDVGLLFHPTELYSSYGLMIRRDSPLADTLVVGCADDDVGYLADPTAYTAGEYSAITVPKILDLPPFTPTAARTLTRCATALLSKLVA